MSPSMSRRLRISGPGGIERIVELVPQVVVADLADTGHPARHDRERLLRVIEGVVR